jgi:hypothetical protein
MAELNQVFSNSLHRVKRCAMKTCVIKIEATTWWPGGNIVSIGPSSYRVEHTSTITCCHRKPQLSSMRITFKNRLHLPPPRQSLQFLHSGRSFLIQFIQSRELLQVPGLVERLLEHLVSLGLVSCDDLHQRKKKQVTFRVAKVCGAHGLTVSLHPVHLS